MFDGKLLDESKRHCVFGVGDRVLPQSELKASYEVMECRRDGIVVAVNAKSRIKMSIPATKLIKAPADWHDAPEMPNGSVAYRLDFDAWQEKRDRDAADPEYQAAMQRYREDFIRWDSEYRQPLIDSLRLPTAA